MYDDDSNKNTYLVFDSVNSIDKGMVDILKHHTFNKECFLNNFLSGKHNILYKSNIEVITDEKYKKQMREQIKLLLGIHRNNYEVKRTFRN